MNCSMWTAGGLLSSARRPGSIDWRKDRIGEPEPAVGRPGGAPAGRWRAPVARHRGRRTSSPRRCRKRPRTTGRAPSRRSRPGRTRCTATAHDDRPGSGRRRRRTGSPWRESRVPGDAALPSREPCGDSRSTPRRPVRPKGRGSCLPSGRDSTRSVSNRPRRYRPSVAVEQTEPDPIIRIRSQHARPREWPTAARCSRSSRSRMRTRPGRAPATSAQRLWSLSSVMARTIPSGPPCRVLTGRKPTVLVREEAVVDTHPHPAATIFEERRDVGAGQTLPGRDGRHGAAAQDVQRAQVSDPDGAVGGRQDGADVVARQTLPGREAS